MHHNKNNNYVIMNILILFTNTEYNFTVPLSNIESFDGDNPIKMNKQL